MGGNPTTTDQSPGVITFRIELRDRVPPNQQRRRQEPDLPAPIEIITFELNEHGAYVETGRNLGDDAATLDAGPMTITLAPNELLR